MLRCIEEMSFDEIATTLNISSETARKRYERARKESYKCLREV